MASYESTFSPRLIYVFTIPDEAHRGCLKIGETILKESFDSIEELTPNSDKLNRAAHKRINQFTITAGIASQLLYTELACYRGDSKIEDFRDTDVHNVLMRSGIKRKEFKGVSGAREWFECDIETVKNAIKAIKVGRKSIGSSEISQEEQPIVFRPEQEEAIERTVAQLEHSDRMLWNAKMRFGKTLCALEVIRRKEFKRTLIITHRPVVDASWFGDFPKIFRGDTNYHYVSQNNGETFESLKKIGDQGVCFVFFASIQDLRGAKEVGGKFEKHHELFKIPWDFIIIDEAHEGTQTNKGNDLIRHLLREDQAPQEVKDLPRPKLLSLSGTPFNLLDGYSGKEIFTWDYVMEQKAKRDWHIEHWNEPNPYDSLPALSIYTYDLPALMEGYIDESMAFNFKEFFSTDQEGAFRHEADIDSFLSLLTKHDEESLYPYSNEKFRQLFRHTLWVLPGVKEAKALENKLRHHPVFGNFTVVNVAGDGQWEAKDALEAVDKAIGDDSDQTYTITLTCGRLTTGVSVKPWTAVLMLYGATDTSAASYMQTIFRVQTPYTHNGLMKTNCYAFDFAPDRALRVFTDVLKVSTKVGKQTDSDRLLLGELLNFLPVISIDGSSMQTYNVDRLLGQLKRIQIERVVQAGFEDGALYNDELLKLDEEDLRKFEELKGIIGQTKTTDKTNTVDINKQGLTEEEYEEPERIKKKKRKELTPEEQAKQQELQEKGDQKREAISILRWVSIRMPLLLYGAQMRQEDEDKELTIDKFANIVDDVSWAEFMPRGVTKELFGTFKKYYDPDVFREAGKRIREMARQADELPIEERIRRIAEIFATFRNPDKETVLTPWRVVNMHLSDCLGGYCFWDEAFEQMTEPRWVEAGEVTAQVFHPESVIMEINSKSGLYPLYATYAIYRSRLSALGLTPETVGQVKAMELWDKTLRENILVLCKTEMAKAITIRTLAGFRKAEVHAEYYSALIKNIIQNPEVVVNTLRDGKDFWKLNDKENMKIDAIIGNPPYQITTANSRSNPVYHLFIDLACSLSQRVSLITPARYLFRAGFTPKVWNDKVLSDKHYKIIWYRANSLEVFPNVDIKGGVAVMYRDREQDFGAIGTFKAFQELETIEKKVYSKGEPSLVEIIYVKSSYRFDVGKPFVEELVRERLGNERSLVSNIFDKLPDLFTTEQAEGQIGIYGRTDGARTIRYISREYIEPHPNIDKYKVVVPESNGSGAIGEVLSTPLIGVPLIGVPQIGATQTFITIGAFETRAEAEACLKYIKTKFARTLLGILKATQHNPKETWRIIPLQDFTESSDIDWSKSIAEIDQQLYNKYGLSSEEIQFIESKVKTMG